MKLYALCAAVTVASTAAVAGNAVYEPPVEPVVVVEEEPAGSMGGSGAWLIPLLAIGLIALAVSQDEEETPLP
jgi:hypothetical protein